MDKNHHIKVLKYLVVSFCFVLASVLFPMTSPAESKADEELKLVFATYIPVGYPSVYPGLKLFVDLVNEKGKGFVKVEPYFGGTLLQGRGLLPGLQAGTADIIGIPGAYLLGSYPILGVHMLPIWPDCLDAMEKMKIGTPLADRKSVV